MGLPESNFSSWKRRNFSLSISFPSLSSTIQRVEDVPSGTDTAPMSRQVEEPFKKLKFVLIFEKYYHKLP